MAALTMVLYYLISTTEATNGGIKIERREAITITGAKTSSGTGA